MSNAGIPLRVIQQVSGHRTLSELQKYLEVSDAQVRGAVSALSMLSYSGESASVTS
jgi:integrase/recombinase XerD